MGLHTPRDYHAEAIEHGEAVRHDTMDRYTTPSGRVLPGVTAILRDTESPEAREGLDRWKARVGPVEAQRALDDGIARGNAMHAAIAAALTRNGVRAELSFRGSREVDPELGSAWGKSAQHVVSRVISAKLVERSAWCDDLGYAGTADLAGILDGMRTCVDWQSKNKPRPIKGKARTLSRADAIKYSGDKRLQVAAYTRILARSRGFECERGIVVVASPDIDAHVIPCDLLADYRAFTARLDEWKLMRGRGLLPGWPLESEATW